MPASPSVWAALGYLIVASPILFHADRVRDRTVDGHGRRHASSSSSHVVSVIGGALLLGEEVTSSILLGAPLVLAGVYIGALAVDRTRRTARTPTGAIRYRGWVGVAGRSSPPLSRNQHRTEPPPTSAPHPSPMLFPTVDFAIFFVVVFLGHWLLNHLAQPGSCS